MIDHLHDFCKPLAGCLATVGLEVTHAPFVLTCGVAAATLVYTGLKIWLISLEIQEKRNKTETKKGKS